MDLILRNARRIGAEHELTDIGIAGGHVAAIEPGLAAEGETIDLGGRLVSPGFVETHIHLDKSCILDRCRSQRGDLEEAIAEAAKATAAFTPEDVHSRAVRTLEKAIVQGTTHMRTHLEVDPGVGLRGLEGVLPLVKEFSWAIDLEICVFPQEGSIRAPTRSWSRRSTAAAAWSAARPIPTAILPARSTASSSWRATTTSTCTWISVRPPRAWISITSAGAHRNSSTAAGSPSAMSPRLRASRCRHSTPWRSVWQMRRGADRAALDRSLSDGPAAQARPRRHPRGGAGHKLLHHGVNCSLSSNNILNPFTPFGDCSQMRMANLYANISQVGKKADMRECFNMVTRRPAEMLRLKDYGLAVGKSADLVVLDSASPEAAVAELAPVLYAFKRGRKTVSRQPATLPGGDRGTRQGRSLPLVGGDSAFFALRRTRHEVVRDGIGSRYFGFPARLAGS